MTVYQIKNEAYTYDVIDLDIVELSETISKNNDLEADTVLRMFMSSSLNNIEFSHLWPEGLNFEYFGKAKKQDYDISRLGHFLIMKMPVYELLKERLANFGEFLPVKAEGNSMMLFNLLTFGQEQKDMCLTKYEDGFEEMYDLRKDPYQIDSVAYNPAYVKTKLALIGEWNRLHDCVGVACRGKSPSIPAPTTSG